MKLDATRYSIIGTQFCEGANVILAELEDGAVVWLVREPTNQYDANAVAVYVDKTRVGYVPKKTNLVLAQFIDQAGGAFMAMDATVAEKAVAGKFVRSPNSGFPMVEVSG